MMKSKFVYWAALAVCFLFPFVGCSDDDELVDPVDPDPIEQESVHAIYVLNSGKFGSNNASLTRICIQGDQVVEQDCFKAQNGRGLGDTAQDILAYGEKMYIAMYGESTIEITDLQARSIKQVKTEGQPRALVAKEGKIYISYYNGYVARLDTASMEVEATVKVGRNPEQMAVYNQKLYVANSGGMDAYTEAGYDKTVSVVDLGSFTETKKIDVALNPCNLQAAENGIYLISMGNYGDVPNTLQWIDPNTDEASVVEALPNATEMAYLDGKLFTYYFQYDENWNPESITFSTLDPQTQAVTTWDPQVAQPYKMCATETNLAIMESDYTNNGNAYFFDSLGTSLKKIETGLNPIKAILVEKD